MVGTPIYYRGRSNVGLESSSPLPQVAHGTAMKSPLNFVGIDEEEGGERRRTAMKSPLNFVAIDEEEGGERRRERGDERRRRR
jgi:hypothetical protein